MGGKCARYATAVPAGTGMAVAARGCCRSAIVALAATRESETDPSGGIGGGSNAPGTPLATARLAASNEQKLKRPGAGTACSSTSLPSCS